MAEEPSKLDISDEMIAERRGGSEKMPDDMPLWMAKSIINIDKFSKWIGNVVCWILMPLIFAMTYEVLARKLFHSPTIWAYDISRFLYGALFMLGAGYALSRGVHIRADFLYRNFKTKIKANRFLALSNILFSRLDSFSLYDHRICWRVHSKRRKRHGYHMDALYVAYKNLFINWNYFFTHSRSFRII